MSNFLLVVAVVLSVLWIAGLASAYTMGGLLHMLLVLALIALIARIFLGRPADSL
jgi:hypothetical protein